MRNEKAHRDFTLNLKSLEDDGTFEGYAAVFGNVDRAGERIDASAFARTLSKRAGEPLPVLWQHDTARPIGIGEVVADRRGLAIKGRFLLATQAGREAYETARMGAVKGLSIGYRVVRDAWEESVRVLKEIELFEVSLVTIPANPEARLVTVKAEAREVEQKQMQEITALTERLGQLESAIAAAKNDAVAEAKTIVDRELSAHRPKEGRQIDEELKAFVTTGESKDYWCRPQVEQVFGKVSDFATKTYLSTDVAPGSSGAGHFFVPELYRDVVMSLQDSSGVLEADPTLVVTNHLRPIQVPVLTVDATATAGTEGDDATDAETEGGVLTLGHFRYDGKFTVSAETAMSAEYDVSNLMATFGSRAVANKVAEMLALGAGTTEPLGALTDATVGVTTASQTAVTPNEMLALCKSVPKGYRKRSKLVVSDALHAAMLAWKDDSDQYLLRSLEGGGYQFAGYPVIVEPAADQSGLSAGEVHAVFGDWSGYFVRMTPLLFHRDDHNPLVVVFRFALWLDAAIADTAALRSLKTHA